MWVNVGGITRGHTRRADKVARSAAMNEGRPATPVVNVGRPRCSTPTGGRHEETDRLTLTTRDRVARNDSTALLESRAPSDEDEEVDVGECSEIECFDTLAVFRRAGSRYLVVEG